MVLLSWVVSSVACRHVFAKITLLPFFYCAAHRFSLVLCQSAQIIKQIKWVFSKVNSFCTFSSSCPDRKASLTSKGINIPCPGENRWYYKSRAVSAIFKQFEAYMNLLLKFKKALWILLMRQFLVQIIFLVILNHSFLLLAASFTRKF